MGLGAARRQWKQCSTYCLTAPELGGPGTAPELGAEGAMDEGAVLSPGECAAGAGRGLVSWQGQDLASLWGSHTGKMIWD